MSSVTHHLRARELQLAHRVRMPEKEAEYDVRIECELHSSAENIVTLTLSQGRSRVCTVVEALWLEFIMKTEIQVPRKRDWERFRNAPSHFLRLLTYMVLLFIMYLYQTLILIGGVVVDTSVQDIIRKRKSVRTFNGKALDTEDRQKLEKYLRDLDNPFDIPVEFRFLDAKEHGLSSPVIIGTDFYIAAKVQRVPQAEIAYGYSFEKFCLYAEAMGIGTVMLAATISRSAFEKAMEVTDNEVMPVASPIGYPADKKSVREKLMRKGIKADERLPFKTLFFETSFTQGLSPEHAGQFRDAFEMVRLAPSAGNKQPWRAVKCGDVVHFYEEKTKALSNNPLGDIQKVDVGIALAHFDMTLKEAGINGCFNTKDPGFEIDDSMEYIVTYEVKH